MGVTGVICRSGSGTRRMGAEKPRDRMLPEHTSSVKLFCNIDASAFAAVMLVLLVIVMIAESAPSHTYGADLPHVSHTVPMPGALRENVMLVTVMRDGSVYFGSERVLPTALTSKILDRLEDRGVERKVYVRADGRAWYRTVKDVLNGVRGAGIEKIGFLLDQPTISR